MIVKYTFSHATKTIPKKSMENLSRKCLCVCVCVYVWIRVVLAGWLCYKFETVQEKFYDPFLIQCNCFIEFLLDISVSIT